MINYHQQCCLDLHFFLLQTSIDARQLFTVFMCEECDRRFCMPSGKNDHRSCFMDHIVSCGAMTVPHKWRT